MLKWNAAESKYIAEQKEHLQMEVLEMRQRCQNELQCLEQRLLSNEHSVRRTQLEAVEHYKISHHNSAREQALNHFQECAQMKKRHLQVQHESEFMNTNQKIFFLELICTKNRICTKFLKTNLAETYNQTDYTRQAQLELKKQHVLKQKNLPRELKVCKAGFSNVRLLFQLRETQIKKQYRHAVKVQSRQFKMFQAQLMQTVSKEEQKEVNTRLKEEQTRKIASLGVQCMHF